MFQKLLLIQSISAEEIEQLSNGSNKTIEYQLLQYPGISNEAFEIFRIGVNFGSFLHHQNQMQQQFKRLIKHLPEDINNKTLKNKLSRIQLILEYISKTTEILKHGFQIKKTNPHLIPIPSALHNNGSLPQVELEDVFTPALVNPNDYVTPSNKHAKRSILDKIVDKGLNFVESTAAKGLTFVYDGLKSLFTTKTAHAIMSNLKNRTLKVREIPIQTLLNQQQILLTMRLKHTVQYFQQKLRQQNETIHHLHLLLKLQELELHVQAYYFQLDTKFDNLMRLLNSDHLATGLFSLTHLKQLYVLHMQYLERQGYFPLSSNTIQSLFTAPIVVTQEDDDIFLYFIIPIHKTIHRIEITELVSDLVIVEEDKDATVGIFAHKERYLLNSKDALWTAYSESEFAQNCQLKDGIFLCNVHKWYHSDPHHHSKCLHAFSSRAK